MLHRLFTLAGVAALVALTAGPASARPYYVTNLGNLGGTDRTTANCLNDAGQVVGYTNNSDGQRRGYFWSNGTMTDMGLPPGFEEEFVGETLDGFFFGELSESGTVNGSFLTDRGNRCAFSYTHGPSGGTISYLFGTAGSDTGTLDVFGGNDNGAVVGTQYDTEFDQAWVYRNGTYTDIGTAQGFAQSIAFDISNNGLIVGYGDYDTTESGDEVLFYHDLSTGGTGTTTLFTIPGAMWMAAISDNETWTVGKGYRDTFPSKAWFYNRTAGTITDIGTFANCSHSSAYDVNNSGQVVGTVWAGSPESGGVGGAFLYDGVNDELINLYTQISAADQAEWVDLEHAMCINESGQIVGYGKTTDYNKNDPYDPEIGWFGTSAFLLTPAMFGDANIDGSVNGTDLNSVLSNYNATISGDSKTRWMAGDFNNDGSVNGTDLNTVLSNYNQSSPYASTAAVPEPSTLLLMVLGLVGLLAWRKRTISTRRVV